jgi:RNA polymerase sigma-70 factor (ECF subfamily)
VTDSSDEPNGEGRGEEPSSISSSLLERLKANSPESWRRFVHLFGPVVYQWCRHRGLQAADAGDVGQNVFREVAVRVSDFRRDRRGDTFRGWLWTITQSKIADYWRSQLKGPVATGGSTAQVRLEQLAADSLAEPDSQADAKSLGSLYRRGLELIRCEFEERTWQAFWRVVVDRCRPAEVADELGMSVNSVYLAKSRVLRRLRAELGHLFD